MFAAVFRKQEMDTNKADRQVLRIESTGAANQLIDQLREKYGALMFHQSGGCCDGSSPMCFGKDEFQLGPADVCIGEVHGVGFYMSESQFSYWEHTHLTLDVVDGMGGQFSYDNGTGKRFHIRSRLYNDDEWAYLEKNPVKHCV